MDNTAVRLGRIRPTLVEDGQGWWPLRAVCDALRFMDYRTASALIPPKHKRRWKDSPKDWRRRKAWCLIDREGVERLVIRYCHDMPRWTVMAALDAGAGMGRDQDRERVATD
jgi:hypothetical protein